MSESTVSPYDDLDCCHYYYYYDRSVIIIMVRVLIIIIKIMQLELRSGQRSVISIHFRFHRTLGFYLLQL